MCLINISNISYMYLVYVDIGANPGDTATLMFTTSALAANRVYDIKVTQVHT